MSTQNDNPQGSLERMVSLIARWRVEAESARTTARAAAERGDKTWEGTMTMRAMAYEDCAAQLEWAGVEANDALSNGCPPVASASQQTPDGHPLGAATGSAL